MVKKKQKESGKPVKKKEAPGEDWQSGVVRRWKEMEETEEDNTYL